MQTGLDPLRRETLCRTELATAMNIWVLVLLIALVVAGIAMPGCRFRMRQSSTSRRVAGRIRQASLPKPYTPGHFVRAHDPRDDELVTAENQD